MNYYRHTAISALLRIRQVIKLRYSEFQQLDFAIQYLEAEDKEEMDNPHFQVRVSKGDGLSLSLSFEYEGFEFMDFRHEFDGSTYPVHIKVNYETGKATQSEGSLEDWEAMWETLLGEYQRSQAEGEESEVLLGFYESY